MNSIRARETTTIERRGGSLRGGKVEDLYAAHGAEALRLAYLMTGDRALAEDLAQEAFVRLLKGFHNLRNPDAFRAYLLRTVMNLTKSHFRKSKREREFAQRRTHLPTEGSGRVPSNG